MKLLMILLSAVGLIPTPSAAEYGSPAANAASATVCEINHGTSPRVRTVSITAFVEYDFEHGFYLEDPRCEKGKDLSNLAFLLRIDSSPSKSGWDDPELAKAGSQEWLKGAIGKHVYCTCIGRVSYSDGYPKFVLDHAERVWASSEDIFK
jgi:hypothetical protein